MDARERRDVRNAWAAVLAGRMAEGLAKLEALLSPGEVTMVREQHRIDRVPEMHVMPVLYRGEAMYGVSLSELRSITLTIYELEAGRGGPRVVVMKIEDGVSLSQPGAKWQTASGLWWDEFNRGENTLIGIGSCGPWAWGEEVTMWVRRACGPNDPLGQYICDDCGRPMYGYHRVGDFALCAACEDEYSARERAALSAQQ